MKRTFLFMLMAIIMSLSGFSQEDYVEIGTQTTYDNVVPFNLYYNNSFSQCLYTAQELEEMGVGSITRIAYKTVQSVTPNPTVSVQIWMGETSNTTLSSATALTESDVELVYTGNVTITDDWFSIDLDNAYDYGGDNLVIIVKKNTQYINPYPSFAVSNANGTCIQRFDDNTVYDFSTLSSLNTYSYRPIVRFWAEVGGCPKAKSIVISDITEESANISWAENEDVSDYKIMIKPSYADDEWEELGTTSETYYELNGLESSTTYLVRIYSECDGVFEQYKEVSFATTTVPLDIPVEISFVEDGGWELINGSCANKWYIGTPSGYEDVSLFLSSTGISATYNNGSVSNVIAERLVNMNDADSIHIEFDFIGSGESSYDYIKVFLMPSDSTLEPSSTANPTYYNNYNYTNMALDFSAVKNLTGNTSYPYMLNLTNNQVIRASGNILNPIHNGTAKLMITWRSDGSGGTTTPSAIINNIYIAPINCPAVSWSATPGSTTIDVEIEGEFAQVKLEYKNDEEEDAEWTEVYITESPYTIEDLNPATNYTIRVTNICDDDEESFVSTKHIQTTQIPATIPYSCDFTEEEENHMWITTSGDANNHWTIGTGTSIEDDGEDMALYISNDEQGTYAATSSSGYIYSYRLIDFGEDPVTARIELDAKCSGFHNAAEGLMYSATIFYLCDPALVPTSGFIDNSNRLGYVVSTEDWTHMTFEKQNISGVKALVCLTWGYSYNASCLVAPAAVDNIVVEASTCSGVVSFTATPNEAGNIVLNWNTGIEDEGGDFVIRYRTDISEEMEQTYVNATGTTHELTDLEPATRYFIYIARVCGEGDTSAFRGPAIIITPCITLNELPYTCDFEGELNGQQPLPYCWNRGNTNTYPQVIDNISFAQSGTHSLYFSGDNIVILPKIDVNTYDISNLEVIFSCYDHNTVTKTFTVGTITDTSDVSTFEPVNTYTFTGTGSNTYSELVSISLAGYEGDAEFIALKLNSGDAYIDDIIVQEAGECSPVSSLSIDGELSIEETTLSWNGYAETYIVRYRTNNTDTWTEEQTNENSITLSDLAPITTYIVEVAPNCEEAIARRYTFTTPCAALTDLPYTCDFETVGTENNPLPACWTRGTVNTSNPYVINNSGNAHNSNRFLYIYGNNVIAALPPVSSSIDLSQTQITFYARHDGSPVNIEIGVMTDPTDMNTYTLVSSVNVNTNTYDFYEIPLSTYNGEGSYVVLKGTNSSNIYVDDITFEFIPACSRPANIEIEPLSTSAIISWTSTGEDFSVFYKQSFDSEYEEATNFESGDEEGTYTLTLSDLNESTSYDFYIVAHCDETNPQSVVLSFNTLQEPVDLPYATDFSGDEETGDRAWILNNYTSTNRWVMGTIENHGALFISQDGTTSGYNVSNTTRVAAEKTFNVGAEGQLHIEFDVKVGGETDFDYLKVFLTDGSWTFPVGTNEETYSNYNTGNDNAMNFQDFLSQTSYSSYPYKLNLTQGNTIHIYTDMTNPNPNGMVKLTFMWRNDGSVGDQPGVEITNLSVGPVVCSAPIYSVDNITSTSAEIVLPEGNEYVGRYKATTDEEWIEIDNTTENVVIEDLNPMTNYTVQMAVVCEEDNSFYTTYNFMTACDVISTLPWGEDFSQLTTTDMGCWTVDNSQTDENRIWQIGQVYDSYIYPMTNGGNFAYAPYGTGTEKPRLISPIFDLSEANAPHLSFYLTRPRFSEGISSGLKVYYRTESEGEWTLIESYTDLETYETANATEGWSREVLALPEHTTSQYYQIMFESICENSDGTGLDSISVYDDDNIIIEPIEPTVVTNAATGIAQTTATLNGAITEVGNQTITARGFEWKATVGGTYTSVSATGTTMTANLTGLTANTSYTYRAFATTSNGTQYGEEVTFTTLEQGEEPCTPATATLNETVCFGETFTFNGNTYNATGTYQTTVAGVNGECDTNYTINLTVNAQNTATETVTVCFGETAEFNGQTLTEGENTITVAGQNDDCDTLYTVTLVVRPENNNTVDVTINPDEVPYVFGTQTLNAEGTYTEVFTDVNGCDSTVVLTLTVNSSINDVENGINVMLYPNPTTEDAMLRVEGINSDATIYVTDVQGRTIKETKLAQGEQELKLETSTLASGVYYIRIVTDTINRTEKLIKK